MADRRNALVGAGYVIAAVNDIGLAYATDEGRTTTTRIESFPNLPGTYAEQVKLTLDFRHIDPARFQAMRTEIDAAIAAGAKKGKTSGSKSRKAGAGAPNVRPRMHRAPEVDRRELGLPYRRDAQPGRPRRLRRGDDGADRR